MQWTHLQLSSKGFHFASMSSDPVIELVMMYDFWTFLHIMSHLTFDLSRYSTTDPISISMLHIYKIKFNYLCITLLIFIS